MKAEFRFIICMFIFLKGTVAVTITSINVPPAVENGSAAIVLDCDYVMADHEKQGLVVQWFLRDLPVPVYQWIPGKRPQDNGPLKGRLNLEYRASDDPYRRHRALQIVEPSVELSGQYRCKVASFENEDQASSSLVIYVPADSLSVEQMKPSPSSVNVSCKVEGVYPEPVLELVREDAHQGERTPITGGTVIVASRNGRYDVTLYKVLEDRNLPHSETSFECTLSLPGTAYQTSQKITYSPGPASSALPPPDNGLDQDAWVDPSTSASPSVSAPHRSPSSSAESIHDDQHAEHRPAHDDNGLWASTGRGIRAHDPLIDNAAGLRSPFSAGLLLAFVIAAKCLC